jgi:hypothetical protein
VQNLPDKIRGTTILTSIPHTMMRSLRVTILAALSAVLASSAAGAQSLPLKYTGKPTQTAITAADAMTRLYIFADDSMMGRRTGDIGGLKGTAYIEREVRRLGLVPAGDNGTFFQAVPVYSRSLDTASRLSADSEPLTAGTDYVPLHPDGTPRPLDGVQVIFAGTGDNMITAAQGDGKAIVITGPTTGIAAKYPGAAAFIVVRADQAMAQVRRFGMGTSTLMREPTDTAISPYTIIVPVSAVQKLLGVPVENARAGTVGRTLHGAIHYTETDAPARNVVAILPGSDAKLKNEYVAIGAHNDHLGLRRGGPIDTDSLRAYNQAAERIYVKRTGELSGFPGSGLTPDERATIHVNVDSLRKIRPARLDSVYNGADDDGSGSVGVLEIAEKFAGAKVKPKRSLLFVWHTGEEEGLFGSEYFTDHPTVPRDSIVAQLNIDMIGRGEATDLPGGGPNYLQLIGSHRLSTELGDLIETVNKTYASPFRFDYAFDAAGHPEQYYCRSDHYEYARYGIPIVFMSTGSHVDYHQITDEPQYINYAHLAKTATLLADVAERVANLDHRIVVDHAKPDPHGQCVQ